MININIKSTNFNMTPEMEDHITSKLTSVEKFLQLAPDEEVLIEFEIEQSTHHKKGEVFRADANLTLNGILHRAETTTFDARGAVDKIKEQLEKQIRRSKSKRFELFQKGARVIKRMLRKNNA